MYLSLFLLSPASIAGMAGRIEGVVVQSRLRAVSPVRRFANRLTFATGKKLKSLCENAKQGAIGMRRAIQLRTKDRSLSPMWD